MVRLTKFVIPALLLATLPVPVAFAESPRHQWRDRLEDVRDRREDRRDRREDVRDRREDVRDRREDRRDRRR
ncbi:MAG TPA: hypothetical protein VI485_27655 [Vicinamibacterales bacterium]|nr:hypothetical protein [Vicinamibacterales bacterium]